ncbi:hypothetical protein EON65_31560 [archaeon]|nr:MAG: hypothetical protein EON65_31560 [archaeon]
MVVDNVGFVYILGSSNGVWAGATNRGLSDIMLMKVNVTLGSIAWVRLYGSSADDIGYSLSYHGKKVYLCGSAGESVSSQPHFDNVDFVVIKADAQTGALDWAESHGGSGEDICYRVLFDPSYNLLVATGGITGSLYNEFNIGDMTTTTVVHDQYGSLEGIEMHGVLQRDAPAALYVSNLGESLFVGGSNSGSMEGQFLSGAADGFLRKLPFSSILNYFEPDQPTGQPSSQPS